MKVKGCNIFLKRHNELTQHFFIFIELKEKGDLVCLAFDHESQTLLLRLKETYL